MQLKFIHKYHEIIQSILPFCFLFFENSIITILNKTPNVSIDKRKIQQLLFTIPLNKANGIADDIYIREKPPKLGKSSCRKFFLSQKKPLTHTNHLFFQIYSYIYVCSSLCLISQFQLHIEAPIAYHCVNQLLCLSFATVLLSIIMNSL